MAEGRHPLHSMSSYLGCFPPVVPQRLIRAYVPKGGTVLDPFCGSGTTLVEATLAGRRSFGIDLNPLAVALARAKVQHVNLESVHERLLELARAYDGAVDLETEPDDIRTIFHPRTLAQLVYLREQLNEDHSEDVFLKGALLGIMHGKHKKGGLDSAYLSIDMPNTFSMSPEYVRKFVKKHQLRQLPLDVFRKLSDRVERLLREGPLPAEPGSSVFSGDATNAPLILQRNGVGSIDAVVTSPPYLGVLRYGAFNWIRLWFLRQRPAPVDKLLDSTDSLDRYLSFLTSFLVSVAEVLKPGAPVALVVGDVVEFGTHLQLAPRIWDELQGVVPFTLKTIEVDQFNERSKTTRIWGEDKKGKATPLDRVLVLERVRTRPSSRSSRRARDRVAPTG